MKQVPDIGRVFYGAAMAVLGLLAIYYRDFPYMMVPPKHQWIPGLPVLAFLFGALLISTGACIVLRRYTRPASILLGSVLLLIFCFYHVPYMFITSSNYMSLAAWENAEKEVALSSGAFIIAGCFAEKNEISFIRFMAKLIPLGTILFCIPILSFGTLHFLYAKEVADYVPSWVPFRLFWAYFCGAALIGSGLAITLKIKTELAALLLGLMIFTWFVILHIPRIVVSPAAYMGSEIASAMLALAYSGIAFVIAGKGSAQR